MTDVSPLYRLLAELLLDAIEREAVECADVETENNLEDYLWHMADKEF